MAKCKGADSAINTIINHGINIESKQGQEIFKIWRLYLINSGRRHANKWLKTYLETGISIPLKLESILL